MTRPDPDVLTLLMVVVISAVSGIVSITQRIVRGAPASAVWFISEFLAAILCGWLASDAYPVAKLFLPAWVTMPVFVAVSAHTGGRILQASESLLHERLLAQLARRQDKKKDP